MARPRNFVVFFVIRVYYEKIGHMLKPLVPKFRSDLSVRLRNIAEKQIPVKLKPIVAICPVTKFQLGKYSLPRYFILFINAPAHQKRHFVQLCRLPMIGIPRPGGG